MSKLDNRKLIIPSTKGIITTEIVGFLGEGAFGKVFEVKINDSGEGTKAETYALKILPISDLSENEKNIILKLTNNSTHCIPNILCYHTVGSDDKFVYLISDKLFNLEQYIKMLPRTKYYNLLDKWLNQSLQALFTIHKNKIMHRDIKPENILVDPSTNQIYISDFGLSCFLAECYKLSPGSEYYISPNLLEKYINNQTPNLSDYIKNDLYGLGVTFNNILFGKNIVPPEIIDKVFSSSEPLDVKDIYYQYYNQYVNNIDSKFYNSYPQLKRVINFIIQSTNPYSKPINIYKSFLK